MKNNYKVEHARAAAQMQAARNRRAQLWPQFEFLTPEIYAADRAMAAELRAAFAQVGRRFPTSAMARSGPPGVSKIEAFGPFKNVPSELIRPAGFRCTSCGRKVKRFALKTPIVPRLMIHVCKCVSVTTWEDETAPTVRTWPETVKLARLTGADILMFNGDREIPASFQGIN